MRALRAPDGCSQFHRGDKGALASFNFDAESAIHTNQDYAICFRSTPDVCGLQLRQQTFNLPGSAAEGTYTVSYTHLTLPTIYSV